MDWIRSLFSSQPGLDRVNPVGIALLCVGAIVALFFANGMEKQQGRITGRVIAWKIGGLIVACIGALIAIN